MNTIATNRQNLPGCEHLAARVLQSIRLSFKKYILLPALKNADKGIHFVFVWRNDDIGDEACNPDRHRVILE